ncbi:MAG: hypothetical protein ABIK15_06050 [Pseudomonadota bacterium]
MKDRIKRVLETTWQYIADDYLAGCEGCECLDSDVFEAIVDADRLLTLGEDKEAAKAFYNMNDIDRWEVFKEQFPGERYGY